MEEILQSPEVLNPLENSELPASKTRTIVKLQEPLGESVDSKPHRQAEVMRQKRLLPKPPGRNLDFTQFNTWVEPLTEDMWSHVSIYCYRLWPVIIRRLANPEADKYIDKICKEHIDGPGGLRGYMVRAHGGGKYRFLVNDLDQQSPKGSVNILEAKLDIATDEAMPVLNLVELDRTSDKNLGYINMLIAKGQLDSKGVAVQPTQTSSQDASSVAGIMAGSYEKFMDKFMKLSADQQAMITKLLSGDAASKDVGSNAIKDILIAKLTQDDPNKGMTMMATVMDAMQKMLVANKPAPVEDKSSGMWERIFAMQTDFSTKLLELSNANRNNGDNEDKWLERMAKYKEIFGSSGGDGGGKKHIAEIIVDGIERIGLPALGLVSQLIQLKTGAKPIIPVTPGQAEDLVKERVPDFRDRSAQAQEPRKVVSIAPPPGSPTLETATPEERARAEELAKNPVIQVLANYGGMLANFIKSGMRGAEIGELIKANGAGFGVDVFAILKAQGRDKIIEGMKMVPAFWNQTGGVMGEEHMVRLVDEFLDFEKILEEEEEEAEQPIS